MPVAVSVDPVHGIVRISTARHRDMLQPDFQVNLLALLFGYLLGSIPFGVVLTRLGGVDDVRSVGWGNIGGTNVLRTGRKGLAAAAGASSLVHGPDPGSAKQLARSASATAREFDILARVSSRCAKVPIH